MNQEQQNSASSNRSTKAGVREFQEPSINLTKNDSTNKTKTKDNIESRKSMFEVNQWKIQSSSSSGVNQINKNTKIGMSLTASSLSI